MADGYIMRNVKARGRSDEPGSSESVEAAGKRPYRKPALAAFGRLNDLTHGPSLGNSESGNPLIFMR